MCGFPLTQACTIRAVRRLTHVIISAKGKVRPLKSVLLRALAVSEHSSKGRRRQPARSKTTVVARRGGADQQRRSIVKHRYGIQWLACASVLALMTVAAASAAQAQSAPPAAPAADATVENIVVIGSQIRGARTTGFNFKKAF